MTSYKNLTKNGQVIMNESSTDLFEHTFKVMLIGDTCVGKTCLLVRFKDNAFLDGNFISTVGIDFRTKTINIDNVKIKLQIWDTAGQERFKSITRSYYRDAQGLLLLYDITNRNTFMNIRILCYATGLFRNTSYYNYFWLPEIFGAQDIERNWLADVNVNSKQNVKIMLLGNKNDIVNKRAVSFEEGEKLAKEVGVAFMETSAKSGSNVDLAFQAISRSLLYQTSSTAEANNFNLSEYIELEQKKNYCCASL